MQNKSTFHSKIATQRLRPASKALCSTIGCILSIPLLIPVCIVSTIIYTIKQLRHSRKEALETLVGIPICMGALSFICLTDNLQHLAHSLIFGELC